MSVLVNFYHIINRQTLVITTLSLVATFLCLRFNLIIDLPSGLIGIAIVFPIVFSINAAYRRREEALRYFASLKASAAALYYVHRDWIPVVEEGHVQRLSELNGRLLQALRHYLAAPAHNQQSFQQVYGLFSELSQSHEQLRAAGMAGNEVSRANQYLRSMMVDFERMRNIFLYRTPKSLRAYSQVFLNVFPIFFAPTFASLSSDHFRTAGYFVAVLYSLILVSLDNIQEDLENPYDQIGVDDLNLDVAEQYQRVLEAADRFGNE